MNAIEAIQQIEGAGVEVHVSHAGDLVLRSMFGGETIPDGIIAFACGQRAAIAALATEFMPTKGAYVDVRL